MMRLRSRRRISAVRWGKNGTEVAKGAADMILMDDNFATIVEAVREGRGIYENIRKAVHFLLSSNIGEIMTIFVAMCFGWATPLLPIQLLWVNLVTDSLPAIALGVDPADAGQHGAAAAEGKFPLFGRHGEQDCLRGGDDWDAGTACLRDRAYLF